MKYSYYHYSHTVLKDSSCYSNTQIRPPKSSALWRRETYIHPTLESYTLHFPPLYRLTSQTKYGPITIAAVHTIIALSTTTTYGAFHTGTSCNLHHTA
jgi:hypothetical protein